MCRRTRASRSPPRYTRRRRYGRRRCAPKPNPPCTASSTRSPAGRTGGVGRSTSTCPSATCSRFSVRYRACSARRPCTSSSPTCVATSPPRKRGNGSGCRARRCSCRYATGWWSGSERASASEPWAQQRACPAAPRRRWGGGVNTNNGWLLGQLPQAMARDRVIEGFVHACQEVADGLRHRVESVDHELDVDLAAPDMLTFVASWLGVPAGAVEGPDRDAQRRLIRAVGQVLGWRGTRRGVETLLEALTGGRVDVSDSGGIFGRDDPLPPANDVVRIS